MNKKNENKFSRLKRQINNKKMNDEQIIEIIFADLSINIIYAKICQKRPGKEN